MGNVTAKTSGEIASFMTPAKTNIKSLKVHFSPKQLGTGNPSPENVREIEGWDGVEVNRCGKNLVPWIKTNLNIQSDHYNGFANWAELWEIPKRISYTYSVFIDNSNCSTAGGVRVWLRDIDNSKYTHTVNGKKIKAGEKGFSTVTLDFSNLPNDYYVCWGLELYQNAIASMPIVYESDQETVIVSDWSSNIGTIYGGYVDLISGELVETCGLEEYTSNDTWQEGTASSQAVYQVRRKNIPTGAAFVSNLITRVTSISGSMNNVGYAGGTYLNVKMTSVTTLEDFLTLLESNPLQIIYIFTTPITHQLTPTQLSSFIGQNNFWSNADYIEIEYDLIETEDIQKAKQKIILNQPQLKTVSDKVVSFNTDMVAPMKNCKIYFNPIQLGSGNPSPTNIRNINGWTGLDNYVNGDKISVDWTSDAGTVYGGYLDLAKDEVVAEWYSLPPTVWEQYK